MLRRVQHAKQSEPRRALRLALLVCVAWNKSCRTSVQSLKTERSLRRSTMRTILPLIAAALVLGAGAPGFAAGGGSGGSRPPRAPTKPLPPHHTPDQSSILSPEHGPPPAP